MCGVLLDSEQFIMLRLAFLLTIFYIDMEGPRCMQLHVRSALLHCVHDHCRILLRYRLFGTIVAQQSTPQQFLLQPPLIPGLHANGCWIAAKGILDSFGANSKNFLGCVDATDSHKERSFFFGQHFTETHDWP